MATSSTPIRETDARMLAGPMSYTDAHTLTHTPHTITTEHTIITMCRRTITGRPFMDGRTIPGLRRSTGDGDGSARPGMPTTVTTSRRLLITQMPRCG